MKLQIDRRQLLIATGGAVLSSAFQPTWAQSAAGNVVIYTSNNQQAVQSITDVAQKTLPIASAL